jgi:ribosome-binding factor A
LLAAANFLRHALAEELSLRHTPELSFEIDHGLENTARVDELLQRIKKR